MTTAQEIHIAINLGIKGINPKIYDSYGDERKDFLFNNIMFSTIKEKIDSLLFTENEKPEGVPYNDLGLLKKNELLPAYYNTLSENYYCIPPADFFGLDIKNIGSRVNWKLPSVTKTSGSSIVRYTALPIEKDSNNFENFKIVANFVDPAFAAIIFNVVNYPAINIDTDEKRFYLINLILEDTKTVHPVEDVIIKVYWEHYGNIYVPNNLIFVTDSTAISNIKIFYKATTVTGTFINISYNIYSGNGTKRDSKIRLISTGGLYYILNDPFGKTHYESPIGEIKEGTVHIFTDDTFIIEKVLLTYYRKPRLIDLALERNCELSSSLTQEIINKTISFIRNTTEGGKINEVINK